MNFVKYDLQTKDGQVHQVEISFLVNAERAPEIVSIYSFDIERNLRNEELVSLSYALLRCENYLNKTSDIN